MGLGFIFWYRMIRFFVEVFFWLLFLVGSFCLVGIGEGTDFVVLGSFDFLLREYCWEVIVIDM